MKKRAKTHFLERVWEFKNAERGVIFVSTKSTTYDQTVDPTDRLSVGGNRSGDPVRLFFLFSANLSTIYGVSSIQFCGSYARAVTGPPERWRNLPYEDLPWQSVYYYFHRWKTDGTFEELNIALNKLDRLQANREALPSVVCVDSQSVKLAPMIWEEPGLDVHKRVNAGPPVRA